MEWKDTRTKKLFEWVSNALNVSLLQVEGVLLKKLAGRKAFYKRVNREDTFPSDFAEHHEVLGLVLCGGTKEALEIIVKEPKMEKTGKLAEAAMNMVNWAITVRLTLQKALLLKPAEM